MVVPDELIATVLAVAAPIHFGVQGWMILRIIALDKKLAIWQATHHEVNLTSQQALLALAEKQRKQNENPD